MLAALLVLLALALQDSASTSPQTSPVDEARRRVELLEQADRPETEELATACVELAVELIVQGAYAEAGTVIERALEMRERLLGPDHPDTAEVLAVLAELKTRLGDYETARSMFERAVAVSEKALGPDNADVGAYLNGLGLLLLNIGDWENARRALERSLANREARLGPEDIATVHTILNLARLARELGEIDVALALAERAFEALQRTAPEANENAACLNLLAQLHTSRSDYAAAQRMYEQAIAIAERTRGPEHISLAAPLHNLASLRTRLGDLKGARPLYERTLRIQERTLGPKHPDTGGTLGSLGSLVMRQGEYVAARPLLEQALAIRQAALGDHPLTALSLENVGVVLENLGQFHRAREHHQEASAMFERTLGPDHPRTGGALGNLAGTLRSIGDAEAALPVAERSLAICVAVYGRQHPETAGALTKLAFVLADLGESEEARRRLEDALSIREETLGPKHPETAESLGNLAGLMISRNDMDAARPLLVRSLAIQEERLGPDHPDVGRALRDLAPLLLEQGELELTREYLERAVEILAGSHGPHHRETLIASVRLGNLLTMMGEYDLAQEHLEQSLEMLERAFGKWHPERATTLNSLALLMRSRGDVRALELIDEALATAEALYGPDHPFTSSATVNATRIRAEFGDLHGAWQLLRRDRAARGRYRTRMMTSMSEGERYRYLAPRLQRLDLLLGLAASLDDSQVRIEAYEELCAWKGQVGRLLLLSFQRLARDTTANTRELLAELRDCQAEISSLPLDRAKDEVRAERLAELNVERNRIEVELRRADDAAGQETVTFEQLCRSLPLNSAVVDFAVNSALHPARFDGGVMQEPGTWSEPRLSAWVTRFDAHQPTRTDLGPSEEVARAVHDHLAAVVGGEQPTRGMEVESGSANSSALELTRVLWAPLEPLLEGIETVFIVPDGVLGTLPFETLELVDGRHLIERFRFVYLQDVASLVRAVGAGPGRFDSLLCVGGVDFDARVEAPPELEAQEPVLASYAPLPEKSTLRGSIGTTWSPLPATEIESAAVIELFDRQFDSSARKLLTREQATEEQLKSACPQFAVLHMATHAFFLPEGLVSLWAQARDDAPVGEGLLGKEARYLDGRIPGLCSGLVCAGASRPQLEGRDDGLLTAEEVSWLDLQGVELVVLSACQTGLGRAEAGEGLIGLRRAFRLAGARTVISSLWSVEDDSTARLMRDFYTNLWMKGLGRLEALRQAQLAMLQRNRSEHGRALVSTWGAFVLNGEWR